MLIPFHIERLIHDKETTFQDFFNLEKTPDNIKNLDRYTDVIKNFRYDVKDALSESKDMINYCNQDILTDAEKSAYNIKDRVSDMEYHIDELEKIIESWNYAYESLLSFTCEIINKENIDISKYSSNITETELNSFRRINKINTMLQDSKNK